MTAEIARLNIKKCIELNNINFGCHNPVEYTIDAYMKVKGGWYVGSTCRFLIKTFKKELDVLYEERMELTVEHVEELQRLAEIGKRAELMLETTNRNIEIGYLAPRVNKHFKECLEKVIKPSLIESDKQQLDHESADLGK